MDAKLILRVIQRKNTLLRRAVRCRIIDSRQSLSSTSSLLKEMTPQPQQPDVSTYEEKDPLPYFLKENIQMILKRITGFDKDKTSELRRVDNIKKPRYDLVSAKGLKMMEERYEREEKRLLQMPPVMQPWQPVNQVLIKDEKLAGVLQNKIVFTDISEGVPDRKRSIVVREKDGTLRLAEPEERDRFLNVYYPREGKLYHMPKMFEDDYLQKLLEQKKYKYILDSACVQFNPDDPDFHRVTTKVYKHINGKSTQDYDLLRSSRHFGPMAFYYAWHYDFDGLLKDMISHSLISDAYEFACLICELHPDKGLYDLLPQDPHADTTKMLSLLKQFVETMCSQRFGNTLKGQMIDMINMLQSEESQRQKTENHEAMTNK